jgi:uncharacterized protein YegL
MAEPRQTELDTPDEDWGESLFAASAEFADSTEARSPGVLLLDTSESMAGGPLAAVARGLCALREELLRSPLTRNRVELAIVTFGSPVRVLEEFMPAERFVPPLLRAAGETLLGGGLGAALDLLEARKARYRTAGVVHTRPWLLLVSDGMPQGEPWEVVQQAVRRLREEEQAGRLALFVAGVEGANRHLLARLGRRRPLDFSGLRFADLFAWLSAGSEGGGLPECGVRAQEGLA